MHKQVLRKFLKHVKNALPGSPLKKENYKKPAKSMGIIAKTTKTCDTS